MLRECSPQSLLQKIDVLPSGHVLVIGDVMLDTYLIGDAQRISPEAPVPVVKVEETRHMLGGAGNVARNIAALGGKVSLAGVIGKDMDGGRLANMLADALVTPHLILDPARPTTTKIRVLARNQQMIRLDQEQSDGVSRETYLDVMQTLSTLLPHYDVIVVSDYDKGLVLADLLNDIKELAVKSGPDQAGRLPKILVDPKPRHKNYYRGAYLLTPNTKETGESAGMPVGSREEVLRAGKKLKVELGLENLLTTLGADGMALFAADGTVMHVATTARQVFDVTGAGDTVIATIALALAAGFPLLSACVLANYAAGIVVGKVGASTASLEELRFVIREFPPEIVFWE